MKSSDVKKGFKWSLLERLSSKAVMFILQLVLARLLVPEDYGLLALILVFVNIATTLVNSGLSSSLIQRKDTDILDESSVFFTTLGLSFIFYLIIFFAAPSIAAFFSDSRMTLMLRIASLTLFVGAYNSVQRSILSKDLKFKELFKSNLSGAIISAVVSLILAIYGFGVWSIIAQYMINQVVITISISYFIRWKPKFIYSFSRVISLWNYGFKYMVTSFLALLSNDIFTATIGKVFSKEQLGEYDTGNRIPTTIADTLSSSMLTVLFPSFSKLQDDTSRLKLYLSTVNRFTTFLLLPFMFCIAAAAHPIVSLVLTEKWIGAVPYLQFACIVCSFYPLNIANIQAINALGKTGITLRNEIIRKLIELAGLFICLQFGLFWVAFGRIITVGIGLIVNMIPNRKLINYSLREQILDVVPNFIIAFIIASIVYAEFLFLNCTDAIILIVQILTGFILFCILSFSFNKKTTALLLNHLRSK